MAILAGAIMTVFSIYTQSLVEIRRAKNRTIATNFAQMMMETIVSSPYDAPSYTGLSTACALPETHPLSNDLLAWKRALDTFPTSAEGMITVAPGQHSHVITIEVRYDDYRKTTRSTLALKIRKKE